MHGATQLMLNHLRQNYWIINARKLVKRHRAKCLSCFRQKPILCEQRMAALPSSRVTPNPPFDKCAVDLCGPFFVKMGGTRSKTLSKAYVVVFVCLATKAVHLECVLSMSTDAFLAAAKRFMSRRGNISEIISDNGSNLVGARNYWWNLERSSEIQESLAQTGTKWKLIPPGAPHFGGLHEAAVKSTKYHMKRTIGQQ